MQSEVLSLIVRVGHFEALWYTSDLWNVTDTLFNTDTYCFWYSAQTAALWSVRTLQCWFLMPLPGHNESWLISETSYLRLNLCNRNQEEPRKRCGKNILLHWAKFFLVFFSFVFTARVAASAAKPKTDFTNNATFKKTCGVCVSVFYLNFI